MCDDVGDHYIVVYQLQEFNPDIFCLSEANLYREVESHEIYFPGYQMILPLTMDNLGYCRIILLVKDEINVKVERGLMDNKNASIWVSTTERGVGKTLFGAIYREFHLLRQDPPNNTDDPRLQETRWEGHCRAMEESKIMTSTPATF